MDKFRLDKTAIWCGTHKENEKRTFEYWQNKTIRERLEAAAYLNAQAWGYDVENPPKMDKTCFSHQILPD
jgi:thiol:disulfide interchange protein